jgi:hypothetical protein
MVHLMTMLPNVLLCSILDIRTHRSHLLPLLCIRFIAYCTCIYIILPIIKIFWICQTKPFLDHTIRIQHDLEYYPALFRVAACIGVEPGQGKSAG